jgi:hypothetical protein
LSALPLVPVDVVAHGQPAVGRYGGRIARIGWSGLATRPGWLWRKLHHKRWHYVGLGDERLFIGVAIVDVGWTCTAFAYLFDRTQRRLLADWRQDGLPGLQGGVSDAPLSDARAWFRAARVRVELAHQRSDDSLQLTVRTPALLVRAQFALADMPPPLLAIGPIAGGIAHATR